MLEQVGDVSVDLETGTAEGVDSGADTISGFENVVGGEGDDSLVGDAGNNRLDGGAGDDVIDGGAGDDTITGGTGCDTRDDTIAGNQSDYTFASSADAPDDHDWQIRSS